MTAAPPAVERLPDLFQGVSYSVLVFLRHLRFWSKAHGEVLRYSTLRQQLRHEDEPLIAGIVLIVLPAAGGKGSARCPPHRRIHRQISASSSQMSSHETFTSSGVGAPSRESALSMAFSSQGKYRNSVFRCIQTAKSKAFEIDRCILSGRGGCRPRTLPSIRCRPSWCRTEL